ncbi:cell division protein FtsA [Candidatus Parcubacteria bacterium]|nr:cell division protein FtsA [Patescibacteria group bacterium]MCG2694250.1 cell division protein FtsA [Candidatus Parcubacteria bacterium]
MQENIIVGLDVGSRSIKMAAGEIVAAGDKEQLHILAAVEVSSEGIKKGVISNVEDVISSISICRDKLERMMSTPIERIYASVNTNQLLCQETRGLVGVGKPNGEIIGEDTFRALEQAQTVVRPSNYEILHVIPRGYSVDGQPNIKDPIGMTGIRLEVDAFLIQMPLTHLKNLTKCIHRTTMEIDDVVLGILANAESLLTAKQKDFGAAVIDIGAATTGLAVYEEGDLIHLAVLPIGSDYITQDINLCFKISLEIAEKLKIKYGSASPKNVSKKEEINLANEGYGEEEIISRKALTEIIEARVEEIFSKVNTELIKVGVAGLLPAGAVLCGGGAKLEGIVDLAKKELRLPVTIGYPLDVSSVSEKISDPSFSTAISLVKWGSLNQDYSVDTVKKIMNKIKGFVGKGLGILRGGFKSIWK